MNIEEIKELLNIIIGNANLIFITIVFAWALIRTVNFFTKEGK